VEGVTAPLPEQFSDDMRSLIKSLLTKSAKQRPSMRQVLELDFVRRHITKYSEFVRTTVKKRRESFKQSIIGFVDMAEVHIPARVSVFVQHAHMLGDFSADG
jgi:hypothetical protein